MPSRASQTPRLPSLTALRTFECAARHGSFQRAADELCVTPAAVSQQIRHLEEELSVQLFERHHRQVELTEAGRRTAQALHHAFALIRDALTRPSRDPAVLRISTVASFASKWLVPRLHRFAQLHPQVQVRIDVDDRFSSFDRNGVDVAVRYGPGEYAGLFVERLTGAEVFPVCHPALLDHPRHPLREPRHLRFHALLHDRAAEGRPGVPDWSSWLAAAALPQVDATKGPVFDSMYLAQEAALSGQGVALGVEPLVADDLARGRLVVPFGPRLDNRYAFWVVCQRARRDDVLVRAFRRWLADEVGSAQPGRQ